MNHSAHVLPLLCLVAGCGSGGAAETDSPTAPDTYLGLSTPAHGLQVRNSGATIAAGQDVEFCEVAELPGDPGQEYFVNKLELGNAAYSHHFVVGAAQPGTLAEKNLALRKVGDKEQCISSKMVFGEDLDIIEGIQLPTGEVTFPPGIAKKFHGGQRLVFDYHYFNTSDAAIEARSVINFHLTDAGNVRQLAGTTAFTNYTIDTPALQSRSFTADCRFDHDVIVARLQRHTHKWGRDFSAHFAGGPRDGELVWTTPHYEEDTDYWFEEPVLVKAGDGFRYTCAFENDRNAPLRFGTSAQDEMCLLTMSIWDAHGAYDWPPEQCDVSWVDEAGIGHDAKKTGFPESRPEDIAMCHAAVGPEAASCVKCGCDHCASILIKCVSDPDCAAIIDCPAGTNCGPVIAAHSAATGMSFQVGACVKTECTSACTP